MRQLVDAVAQADGIAEVREALNAVLAEAQRLEDENLALKARVVELEMACDPG